MASGEAHEGLRNRQAFCKAVDVFACSLGMSALSIEINFNNWKSCQFRSATLKKY
jgi:hypothetical protein